MHTKTIMLFDSNEDHETVYTNLLLVAEKLMQRLGKKDFKMACFVV